MFTNSDFRKRIMQLPITIPSKTGKANYTSFNLDGDILSFHRNVPKTNWNLSVSELYSIYRTRKFINTSVIKSITNKRVNSPSVAVLIAIGCIDITGVRI